MTTINKYRIYCNTETSWQEDWAKTAPSVCPNNNGHSVNTNSVQLIETVTDTNKIQDTLIDGFGRVRVSEPQTIFDCKQVVDNAPLFFDEALESGSGITATYENIKARTLIESTANTAGKFTRQSFRRFNYQPGKSFLILMTGVLAHDNIDATGSKRRIGYFDDNNGIFFENNENGTAVVIRTKTSGSPVDTQYYQTNWNKDTLDGNGNSGYTLDLTKTQIFFMNFEWLGVGIVAFGFVINKEFIICHQENHANILDVVYMSTPNLPIRYQMETSSSTPAISMSHICNSIISEGGYTDLSIPRSYTTPSQISLGAANGNKYVILGLRLNSSKSATTIQITKSLLLLESTSDIIIVRLIFDGTPSSSLTWNSITNSSVEESNGNGTIYITGGTIIDEYYVTTGNNGSGSESIGNMISNLNLGQKIDGTPNMIYLTAEPLQSLTKCYGTLQWREF